MASQTARRRNRGQAETPVRRSQRSRQCALRSRPLPPCRGWSLSGPGPEAPQDQKGEKGCDSRGGGLHDAGRDTEAGGGGAGVC